MKRRIFLKHFYELEQCAFNVVADTGPTFLQQSHRNELPRYTMTVECVYHSEFTVSVRVTLSERLSEQSYVTPLGFVPREKWDSVSYNNGILMSLEVVPRPHSSNGTENEQVANFPTGRKVIRKVWAVRQP